MRQPNISMTKFLSWQLSGDWNVRDWFGNGYGNVNVFCLGRIDTE